MAKTFLEAIGYRLGQKAAQAKNAFDLMGGSEEESANAEIRLGRDLSAALLEKTPLVEENDTTRFAGEVGRWLSAKVTERKLPFAFWVTAEQSPSALGLPGGPVFVSWPLLEICQGERDEIAFVLGHEMAHIVLGHALDRIVRDAALSLLLRQTSGRAAASSWLGRVGRQTLSRGYAREEELDADAFALRLLRNAGGDTRAGERLLEKFAQWTSSHGLAGDYLAGHPPVPERLALLRAKLMR